MNLEFQAHLCRARPSFPIELLLVRDLKWAFMMTVRLPNTTKKKKNAKEKNPLSKIKGGRNIYRRAI